MDEETKKKKKLAPIEDPPATPEPEPEPEDETPTPDPDPDQDTEPEAEADPDTILEAKVLEILRRLGLIKEPETSTEKIEVEEVLKQERARVSGLLEYQGLVTAKKMSSFISEGKTVQDLALEVLESKKAELEKKRGLMASAEKEEPLSAVSEIKEAKGKEKSTVSSLASFLMPKGSK